MQNIIFYNNTLPTWIIALSFVAGTFAVGKLILFLNRKVLHKWVSKTATQYDDVAIKVINMPLMCLIILIGIGLGIKQLQFDSALEITLHNALYLLVVLNVAWLLSNLSKALITEYLRCKSKSEGSTLDKFWGRSFKNIINIIIWLVALLMVLKRCGIDIRTIVAGLGIGGIAVALAAQDTLKNIFGGITLVFDRPFKLGDFIKVGNYSGNVEHIGLRSTRIITLQKRLLTIPNSNLTDAAIENFSKEPTRRIALNIGVSYRTSPQKMREALQILQNMHQHIKGITHEINATFVDFGKWQLVITLIYYINKKKFADICAVQTEVNLFILQAFNEAGLEMNFPPLVSVAEAD
ncbi:transporter [Bacteroidia bacterium]|nr:transporter [Bacteroidia bacterium]